MNNPLVSCLCVTESRVEYLKKAIDCFLMQSYENKEMIIVFQDRDFETIDFLSALSHPRIKTYGVSSTKSYSLGELRNISIEAADGDFICQWDDDDWYHRDRLQQQVRIALECNKEASVLKHLILFNKATVTAYFSFPRIWENTILCSKRIYKAGHKYQSISKQEDTFFVKELIRKNKLCSVSSYPTYIYIQHGKNTWNEAHFNHLYSLCQRLSPAASDLINSIVTGADHHDASNQLLFPAFLEELDFFHSLKVRTNEK